MSDSLATSSHLREMSFTSDERRMQKIHTHNFRHVGDTVIGLRSESLYCHVLFCFSLNNSSQIVWHQAPLCHSTRNHSVSFTASKHTCTATSPFIGHMLLDSVSSGVHILTPRGMIPSCYF